MARKSDRRRSLRPRSVKEDGSEWPAMLLMLLIFGMVAGIADALIG